MTTNKSGRQKDTRLLEPVWYSGASQLCWHLRSSLGMIHETYWQGTSSRLATLKLLERLRTNE